MQSADNPEESQGALVLVADDDPAIRMATARVCRQEGCRVLEASNGVEALARIREDKPDLALLDVDLGDMDGRDICRTLRGEPECQATFMVMVSGTAVHSEDRIRGLEGGADGYLVRPIGNRELAAWINAFLRIREAEHRRRAAERALEQTGRYNALGTLAGGIGHEIANPLMGIINYVQLIRDNVKPGDEIDQFAQEIENEGNRIKTLIETMRKLGHADLAAEAKPLDLNQVVESTVDLFRVQFESGYGIRIEVDLRADERISVPEADLVYALVLLLKTARNNLVRRSANRTDPKWVQVSAHKDEAKHCVRLSVEDNGGGLPPDVLDHLFEPFFTPNNRAEDSGLDLPVVYRVVQKMGGELSVESKADEETTFLIDFPCPADEPTTEVTGGKP